MTEIAEHQTPFLPRGVRLHHCEIRKGWYLLAPERAVKMNDIGVAILNVVDGERDFAAVIEKLASDFKAPRDRIAADAGKFLVDLVNRRMVEVRP
jgi:pyrroloquinoline quinone biosynthesis protein D